MLKKLFLFFSFSSLFVADAWAWKLTQNLDVQIGFFDAARIKLMYQETENDYHIIAEVKTNGVFDTIYPFEGKYESLGKNLGDSLQPQLYKTYTKSRNHVRTKEIAYDKRGQAYQRVSTKDNHKTINVIDNIPKSADVADLQIVLALMTHQFQNIKQTRLKKEVYDGKKHFKVIVKDEKTDYKYFDILGKAENSYKSSLYIENLKDNNDNILWNVSSDRPIKMWFSFDEKTKKPFLLEIKIDSTPLGELKVIPTTLEIK